ncbi:hypothetical protein DPMN_021801 [Dreissena polymorpha]|uniref:Uncharacterized protein n=1 Tax=Dreissena polymorpha TaxID=45954 RepID=A0A9D4NPH2_DREPO|nr:hypothetical protein DPMN_021801 [Dreissena polymorpha]
MAGQQDHQCGGKTGRTWGYFYTQSSQLEHRGVALYRDPGTAVLSTLNTLGKLSRG